MEFSTHHSYCDCGYRIKYPEIIAAWRQAGNGFEFPIPCPDCHRVNYYMVSLQPRFLRRNQFPRVDWTDDVCRRTWELFHRALHTQRTHPYPIYLDWQRNYAAVKSGWRDFLERLLRLFN